MPSRAVKKAASRQRSRKPAKTERSRFAYPPQDLASQVRGLYRRVASELGVDPSYVSRVARGERRSQAVDAALRRALNQIVLRTLKQGRPSSRTGARKTLRKG